MKEMRKAIKIRLIPLAFLLVGGLSLPVGEAVGFPRSETLFVNNLTGVVGTPSNFNEWVGWKHRDRGLQNLAFEGLWTNDYVLPIHNSAAAGPPEYNEDFTQFTVRLREGVYWSDGVEFTADDVVFTIELIRDTPGLNYHPQMQAVERVYAADRYTVVVELIKPDSRFHTHFIDTWGAAYIMPKHIFEPVAAEGAEALMAFEFNPPVGKGPYVLHSYDPLGSWTAWVRRDDWDRTPAGMLFGKPGPRYVVSQAFPDEATMVMAMVRHELDSAFMTLAPLRAVLIASPYARAYRPDYPWIEGGHPAISGVAFNTMKPPFDNRDVRWALVLATDIISYIATAFDGVGEASPIHLPTSPLFVENYHKAMVEWLKDFTLDIGDGESFKPFDPDVPYRLAEYAEARGFPVPDIEFYGIGWWKYAPDIAARLLENHGFSRDADGKWLLPDGTPWRFEILSTAVPTATGFRNAFAAMHEWRRFGIDVSVTPHPVPATLAEFGHFDAVTFWPVISSWGGHVCLHRGFQHWHSNFAVPIGEQNFGHASRWSDPRMDAVVAGLEGTDWTDHDRIVQLGIEGLKIAVEEMPGMPTFSTPDSFVWSTRYWTNWPGVENPFGVPHHHWSTFKYVLPFLEPTGR